MNPFKSFQPEKRRKIGPSSNGRDTVEEPAVKLGSVRSLLAQLNDNPFDLSIVSSDLKVPSAEQSAVQILRPLTRSYVAELKNIGTQSRALQRQITIEANFDLKPLLQNALNTALKPCHIYPACQREADPYRIAEYVTAQLSKTRHWSTRASELPYLGHGDSSTVSKTGPNLGLMAGVSKSAAQSSNTSSMLVEGEAALTCTQSHLLKWQEALHALLGQLLEFSAPATPTACGERQTPYFYVLGRSVLLPQHARLQNGPGGRLPLPYTSALFYLTPATVHPPLSDSAGKDGELEPACLLLGVYKAFLLRLKQLGVEWTLVEDINSPVPLSKAEASNRGKSAAISIASNKASVDPHASTAALFNSRKLGVDILVRGRYAVTVVAQVLNEGVFDALQVTRASPTDVPVLFSESSFAHSVPLHCDIYPVQCQYDFNSGEADTGSELQSTSQGAQDARRDKAVQSRTQKVQLVGLFPSTAVRDVVSEVLRLAQQAAGPARRQENRSTRQGVRRRVSAAYAYLSNPATTTSAAAASLTSHDGSVTPGTLLQLGPGGKPAAVPTPAVMNPMTLVTAVSRSYAPDESDIEEELVGTEAGSEAESELLENASRGEEGEAVQEGGSGKTKRSARLDSDESGVTSNDAKKSRREGASAHAGSTRDKVGGGAVIAALAAEEGFVRTEEWLRQQRDGSDSSGGSGAAVVEMRFFHIQCSLVTPRMGQFSYATPVSPAVTQPPVPVRVGEYGTLSAVECIEEVRWRSDLPFTRDGTATVEVVTTTLPRARLRDGTVESAQESLDAAGGGKDGMVLDALNKYTIFVDNRIM